MKEINELYLPDDVKYTDDHEWARQDGESVTVGISDYATDQMGDIVYVELPEVGRTFKQDEEFGTVESVKAVSELYMPVSGEIVSINSALEDAPELVNNDPYQQGWMIKLTPSDVSEMDSLKDKNAYLEMLKG
ncbi:MAG: glycine cleavage system protein GcvH [Thermodesulfobacteriota bacterium]|nr:glycine cleavage system protein GcvH [Thermodesulfobacteriota bacterium]